MNQYLLNGEIATCADIPRIDLFYPRSEGNADTVEVGLCCVRAADCIRISYDFERDGYCIKQTSYTEESPGMLIDHDDWQEVAFVQAWGRERET